MAKKRYSKVTAKPGRVSETKVAMSYRLSPAKIARAQAILGEPTATATIEAALDSVVFRHELISGLDKAFGLRIEEVFPDRRGGSSH